MPDTLNGVPLHPLVVHAVVVLVPLAGLFVLGSAVSGRFRAWSGLLTPLLALAALASVPLATSTGEQLEDRVTETALMEKHAEMGEALTPWVIGLAVVAVLLWWLGRRTSKNSERSGRGVVALVVAAVALVAVGGSSYEVYRIGHSGAEAVWTDTGSASTGEDD